MTRDIRKSSTFKREHQYCQLKGMFKAFNKKTRCFKKTLCAISKGGTSGIGFFCCCFIKDEKKKQSLLIGKVTKNNMISGGRFILYY